MKNFMKEGSLIVIKKILLTLLLVILPFVSKAETMQEYKNRIQNWKNNRNWTITYIWSCIEDAYHYHARYVEIGPSILCAYYHLTKDGKREIGYYFVDDLDVDMAMSQDNGSYPMMVSFNPKVRFEGLNFLVAPDEYQYLTTYFRAFGYTVNDNGLGMLTISW